MERSRVREKIKEEFLAVLPPTLFFFVALHLVAFIRVLTAEAHGIHVTSTVSMNENVYSLTSKSHVLMPQSDETDGCAPVTPSFG